MQILLVGNFGAKNLGDELILLAALQDYPAASVMTADSAWTQQFCEETLDTVDFPPTAFRSWWKYWTNNSYRQEVRGLKRFDRIIFVGGGLFAIKLRACVLWWQVFRWFKQLNPQSEIWFEYQGVDKRLGLIGRWMMRSVLSQADFVSVRDEISLEATSQSNIKGTELKTDRFWETDFGWITSAERQNIVLVNALRPISTDLLKKLKRKTKNQELVFVAFQASDLQFVPKDWSGRVEFPATRTELFELFDQAELAIGERLHFLLMGSKVLGPKKVKLLRDPYAEKVATFQQTLKWKQF